MVRVILHLAAKILTVDMNVALIAATFHICKTGRRNHDKKQYEHSTKNKTDF